MLVLTSAVLAQVSMAADVDEARVKSCVARFLEVSQDQIKWPPTIQAPSGAQSWFSPISLRLSDPPTIPLIDGANSIFVKVHPTKYYVQGVTWEANLPPETPKFRERLSLDACEAIGEQFARSKLKSWPKDMRVRSRGFGPLGLTNPTCGIWWDEWDGLARTGTHIRIRVNPRPPGSIYSFSLYLAPLHSIAAAKVTREQAINIACEILRKAGAENPRVFEDRAELYLSEPNCEQPHWMIALDYDNRRGGFIEQVFIDAVTGERLTPTR